MYGIHDIWLFVGSGLLLNITPGPDMLYIIARSTNCGTCGAYGTSGLRAGVAAALGIGAGCSVHIAAAAFGLSAVLATSATAFTVVKLLGAAYLLYMGAAMLLARKGTAETAARNAAPRSERARHATSADQPPPTPLRAVFAQGFLTNALNPKVALFFLAFLPQFVDGGGAGTPPSPLAFLVLGCIFTVNGTLVNLLVAWGAARLGSIFQAGALGGRFARWGDRCLGALLLFLGVRLALAERG
ncbi:LysE family translocator [Nitratidesulfovibrio sp.]|uniref:LysE family translocator n=1 Tax=Nitratidesulfovibrio sp. TaxID=2802297 RepID=UPI00334252B2